MPDAIALDFTLRTTAELAGAEQLAAELEKAKGAAKAAGQDFTVYDEKLKKVRESILAAKISTDEQSAALSVSKEKLGPVISDAERYQLTLQRMAVAQETERRASLASNDQRGQAWRALAQETRAKVDGVAATDDLAKKTADATKATGEHETKLLGSKLVLNELNKIVPGLGHALHAAFTGPLGPLILLTAAVSEARQYLAEYNAELDKIPAGELAAHSASIASFKGRWDEAQIAMGKYYAGLNTAGIEKDPIKKQLDNIKALAEAEIDAAQRVTEALMKQEIQNLRTKGASPDQIAAAEERLRRQTEFTASRKEHLEGEQGLRTEQQMREAAVPQLRADAEKRAQEAKVAKDAFARAQEDLQKGRDAVNPNAETGKANAKKLEDAQKKLERAQAAPDYLPSVPGTAPIDMRETNQKRIAEAQAELSRLQKERANQEQRNVQLEADERAKAQAAQETATREQAAKESETTNETRRRQLPGEIDQAQKVQGIKDQGRSNLDIINRTGQAIENVTTAGNNIDTPQGQQEAAKQLKESQAVGRELAQAAVEAATSHKESLGAIQQALADLRAANVGLVQRLNRVESNTNLH